MSAKVFRRVIKDGDKVDISLVPASEEDKAKIKKLPVDVIVEITIKVKRRHESLATIWTAVHFVYDHKPEQYEDNWNSSDELYKWLKFAVGWVEVVGKGDSVFKIARDTNFTNEKNETEVKNCFVNPALDRLALIMGYPNRHELIDAAIDWSKMKRNKIF